ncbi:hypothetical protein [Modicisalibacter tunisiensis]|uniref:Uncharacterized protein n=1 Tax=Modicisalibacter tunisiensis TaxID=390637 RepID=A0ABS7WXG5_9GAMM|nr:hypothetical protein [Modicisalibacter tunisiensis]KXS39819.1 MAG: hypothetical protein AWU55_194 [Halomonadaceae bacterium T82-2]MBZ9567319.1 hypothetical protein [Modicisalibacter tunisiensis]
MLWQLIAAIFAGLGAAGIGLILRQLSGKRLPRWIVPALGGLGMLAYQIHYEYTWFDNKQARLPASAQVVSKQKERMFWRPWTYIAPLTTGFDVIDRDNLVTRHADGERLVEFILYHFERQPADQVSHHGYLLNCDARDLVPLADKTQQPQTQSMRHLETSAPLYRALCAGS